MIKTLMVRIHRVTCIDETGGSIAERVGNDEMYLCGYAIDNANNITPIRPVSIYGNFDDGDVKTFYNPLTFHQFTVDTTVAAPQNFGIVFILVERDRSDNYEIERRVNEAVSSARKNIQATGTPIVPGSPEQMSKWQYATTIVSRFFISIATAIADDFFPPVLRTSTITNGEMSDPYMEYFTVKAHDGTYKVEHDWHWA